MKLSGNEKEIRQMVKSGWNNVENGKLFGVHRSTVMVFKSDRLKLPFIPIDRKRACKDRRTAT